VLDECQVSDGGRKQLLSEIDFQANTDVTFFATSRFILHIEKDFEEGISLEIRAGDAVAQRYLRSPYVMGCFRASAFRQKQFAAPSNFGYWPMWGLRQSGF
jgi:hypothetical protein